MQKGNKLRVKTGWGQYKNRHMGDRGTQKDAEFTLTSMGRDYRSSGRVGRPGFPGNFAKKRSDNMVDEAGASSYGGFGGPYSGQEERGQSEDAEGQHPAYN